MRFVFYEKNLQIKHELNEVCEVCECYLILRSGLRMYSLTRGVLWKIVNSLGGDTQFHGILGGGIY